MGKANQSGRPGARTAETERDEGLRALVLAALRSIGYPPLRELECDVREGVVVLSGVVPTFYLKQMAQAIVLRVGRVAEIRNLVLVRRPGEPRP